VILAPLLPPRYRLSAQVDTAAGDYARRVAPLRGADAFMVAAGWQPRAGAGGRVYVVPQDPQQRAHAVRCA
jgi:hypothetical protein